MENSFNIPQEIIDLIIDHVNGSEHDAHLTLKTCALISKLWRYRSQKYIFHRLTFDSAHLKRAQDAEELIDSPWEGVTTHVRQLALKVHDSEDAVLNEFLRCPGLTKLMSRIFCHSDDMEEYSFHLDLKKLRKSSFSPTNTNIWSSEKLSWETLPEEFTTTLMDTICSTKLADLRIMYFSNIPILFLGMTSVKTITLNNMGFEFAQVPYPSQKDNNTDDYNPASLFFLKDFNISLSDSSKVDFSAIKKLRCTLQEKTDWFSASTILHQCVSCLESLEIVVDCSPALLLLINLNVLERLKSLTIITLLTIDLNLDVGNYHVIRACEVLLQAGVMGFGTQPEHTPPRLETIDIHISLGSIHQMGGLRGDMPYHGYSILDEILVSTPVLYLSRAITVHFFFPWDIGLLDYKILSADVLSKAKDAFPMALGQFSDSFRLRVDLQAPIDAT